MLDIRNLGWWYWLATVPLLAASLIGEWQPAIPMAQVLTAGQAIHFLIRTQSARSFPVQVRLAYLGLLTAGLWPPLRVLHWIQLAGTSSMVLVGYCPLARCLSLLPWNRAQPLTASLLRKTFLSPPVRGSILRTLSPTALAPAS
jgi:hypothetical protein